MCQRQFSYGSAAVQIEIEVATSKLIPSEIEERGIHGETIKNETDIAHAIGA